MFKHIWRTLLFVLLLAPLAACGGESEPVTLTVVTHDSFSISDDVLAEFETESGIMVDLLPSGDAGAMLNQLILTADEPLGDVVFGIDNTFLSRALEADILIPYESPLREELLDTLLIDASNRLTPVDYGDVCLNYDVAYFAEAGIAPPQTLADLTDPAFESLVVVEDPATSSPGLAFLLATIDQFGTDGDYTYVDFWADMRANDVLVTSGWNDAYYGHFTVASDGNRPVVVSYATSPPAEVIFADPPLDEAPSRAVLSPGTCYRQVEFVGILQGTEHEDEARQLIDFMLSTTFQEDIPLNMFVFPANVNAELPEAFVTYGGVADDPAQVAPQLIEENRESWINTWADTVLR